MAIVEAIRSANNLIKGDLITRQNTDYIDVFTAMIGPDGLPRPELFAEDGLHLSEEGYQVWAREILNHTFFLY